MLVLLLVEDIPRRKGLMRLLCPNTPPAPVQYFTKLGSTECVVIKAKRLRGAITWDVIGRAVGNHPIIMPKEVTAPTFINRHSSHGFLAQVLFNTAEKIILSSKTSAKARRVSVLDLKGEWCQQVVKLTKLAGTVRVHTENPRVYEKYGDMCYKEQGVQIIVTSEAMSQYNFDFALCPNGDTWGPDPAIMIKNCHNRFCLVPRSVWVSGISSVVPKGICHSDVISALYEYEGHKRLGHITADFLVHNGYKVFADDLMGK
ncbi:MAG: hypothetical protein IJF54_06930 [Clostridia bacterium]|nr:hypothetical protein [Clostridia bacterium]